MVALTLRNAAHLIAGASELACRCLAGSESCLPARRTLVLWLALPQLVRAGARFFFDFGFAGVAVAVAGAVRPVLGADVEVFRFVIRQGVCVFRRIRSGAIACAVSLQFILFVLLTRFGIILRPRDARFFQPFLFHEHFSLRAAGHFVLYAVRFHQPVVGELVLVPLASADACCVGRAFEQFVCFALAAPVLHVANRRKRNCYSAPVVGLHVVRHLPRLGYRAWHFGIVRVGLHQQ